MIDLKDLNLDPVEVKKKLKELGIDMATLKRAAKVIQDIPELQPIFRKQANEKGFKGNVDKVYKEVKDIFDHDEETPDGDK